MISDRDLICNLRDAIGLGGVTHLTGLDRRTIQRIAAGETDLYPETRQRVAALEMIAGAVEPVPLPSIDPLTDPRPFADVLRDWIARHGGSVYAVADGRILSASAPTVRNWLDGRPCPSEREVRALMTFADEGRVQHPRKIRKSSGVSR